jgi:CHAT domain-containing protein
MTRFYEQLVTGLPVGQALQKAWLAVRGMTGPDRDEAYETLCTLSGTAATSRAARDADPLVPVDPKGDARHPYFWAPFIHVGV